MIIGEEKPPLGGLSHSGVKGMKWGVRRAEQPTHASYTPRKQANDRQQHGARAVKRINRRLNEGETRAQAQHHEDVRKAYKRLAVVGGAIALSIIADSGPRTTSTITDYIGNRANANRAAAKVRDVMPAISAKASKITYAKTRGGVHNITTMK
jgi:hypothetical protein